MCLKSEKHKYLFCLLASVFFLNRVSCPPTVQQGLKSLYVNMTSNLWSSYFSLRSARTTDMYFYIHLSSFHLYGCMCHVLSREQRSEVVLSMLAYLFLFYILVVSWSLYFPYSTHTDKRVAWMTRVHRETCSMPFGPTTQGIFCFHLLMISYKVVTVSATSLQDSSHCDLIPPS